MLKYTTMRFRIKQKVLSFRDRFEIECEDGKDVYHVVEKYCLFGRELSFRDQSGNEILYIVKRSFFTNSKYEVLRNGQAVSEVTKHFSLFGNRLSISMLGYSECKVTGSYWSGTYSFDKKGYKIASISKDKLAISDLYEVEISDIENHEIVLAVCIVVDAIFYDSKISVGG
jgi:uncharacterized protein YxjI